MKKSLGARTLVYPLPVWVVGTYDTLQKRIISVLSQAGMWTSSPNRDLPAKRTSLSMLHIGEIMDVKADELVLGEKGITDIEKLKPVIFAADTG